MPATRRRSAQKARGPRVVLAAAIVSMLNGPAAVAVFRAEAAKDVAVVALETDAAASPLGIDDPAPRFTWRLSGTGDIRQVSVRVLVASRTDLLVPGKADVWDSGESSQPDPSEVYRGPALKPHTRYYWTVDVVTNHSASGIAAEPAWFETGLPTAGDWRGHWIAGPERRGLLSEAEGLADDAEIRAAGEFCRPVSWLTKGWSASLKKNNQGECRELRPAPMFRKSFRLAKPVAAARLYSTGLAYADLAVNGTLTSTRVLEPAFTNYSKTVLYVTDDVTGLLRQGDNVLSAVLGSGQFDDAARTWDWGWETAEWRATPRLRADLRITYTDGTEEVIGSDATWKVSVDGPTRFDNYYLGETFDARREKPGWNEPGFDDRAWAGAREVDGPSGEIGRAHV